MQIKIHSAQNSVEGRQVNSRKASRQGSEIKMTLNQYLQSVNLKRRINSRSKQKRKLPTNDPHFNNSSIKQIGYLQAPVNNPTVQYYKLNQQWKAIKQFNTWIVDLKELCRDYIKKDAEYVEVARLIEKISQFVKSEVEMIKRDHLLLQSFLVTEASYWGEVEGTNLGDGNLSTNNPNFDKFSNYVKAVLSTKSQNSHESPTKFTNEKQRMQQNLSNNRNIYVLQSPQQNHSKDVDTAQQSIPTNHKVCYKISTEPKSHTNSFVKYGEEKDTFHRLSTSSGKIGFQSETLVNKKEDSREYNIDTIRNPKHEKSSREKQQQYIYSFNDKNALKVHNLPEANYKKNHLQSFSNNNPHINSFQQSTNKIQEQNYPEELGLLRIQSRNQDQVPRLSLMSRYDQNKQHSKNHTSSVVAKENDNSKKEKNGNISNSRTLNEYLKKIQHNKCNSNNIQQKQQKQHQSFHNQPQYSYHQSQQHIFDQSSQKPPLRQRRHKTQKLPQQSLQDDDNQFQMIKLDVGSISLSNQIQQKSLTNHYGLNRGQKINLNQKESSIKVQNSNRLQSTFQSSPSIMRQSPHVISIQTPSTLHRRYLDSNESVSPKRYNEKISINKKDTQSHQKINQIARMSDNNGKRLQSRSNIMTRYQNFRKAN